MKYVSLLLLYLSATFLYYTARPNAKEVKLIERRKNFFFQKPSTMHNLISHPRNAHSIDLYRDCFFFFSKSKLFFPKHLLYVYILCLFVSKRFRVMHREKNFAACVYVQSVCQRPTLYIKTCTILTSQHA